MLCILSLKITLENLETKEDSLSVLWLINWLIIADPSPWQQGKPHLLIKIAWFVSMLQKKILSGPLSNHDFQDLDVLLTSDSTTQFNDCFIDRFSFQIQIGAEKKKVTKPCKCKVAHKISINKQTGQQMEREMEGAACWRSDGGRPLSDDTQGLIGSVKAGIIAACARSYQLPDGKYTFLHSHWTALGFSPVWPRLSGPSLTWLLCRYRNVWRKKEWY